MKPREILLANLEAHVEKPLRECGFSLTKSRLTFKRDVDIARQQISFSLSSWNSEDNCRFWTMWGVTSNAYRRWFEEEWGVRPPNDALGGCADWNIAGWPRRPANHVHLTNSECDASIMAVFVEDMLAVGLPFLDSISNWASAAAHLMENHRYSKACDCYLLAGQREDALEALIFGKRHFGLHGRPDQLGELPEIDERLAAYFESEEADISAAVSSAADPVAPAPTPSSAMASRGARSRALSVAQVRQALRALLLRTHSTACVVVEDEATEKFVQFGRGPNLVLDLPMEPLTEYEAVRAHTAFADLGITEPRRVLAPALGGVGDEQALNVYEADFGKDFDLAAEAAIDVFHRVYQLEDPSIVVYET